MRAGRKDPNPKHPEQTLEFQAFLHMVDSKVEKEKDSSLQDLSLE